MRNLDGLAQWNAQQLYDEYKLREKLIPEMLGWLYSRVLRGEMEKIEKVALDRYGYHPNWFIERGLVTEKEQNSGRETKNETDGQSAFD